MKPLKIAVIVVLALMLLGVVCTDACRPRPFSLGSSGLVGSAFEGFGTPLDYTTYPGNAATDSLSTSAIMQSASANKVKVAGYGGLFSTPTAKPETLDVFSQATSKPDCKSYGLMGSMGYLCLSDDQIRLLRSRGGNLTGAEAQIG